MELRRQGKLNNRDYLRGNYFNFLANYDTHVGLAEAVAELLDESGAI